MADAVLETNNATCGIIACVLSVSLHRSHRRHYEETKMQRTQPAIATSIRYLLLIVCLAIVRSIPAVAQDNSGLAPAAAADLEPLVLPDTSSPRATLRTFLTNAARAAELARQGAADIFANPGFIQTSGMEETTRAATAAAHDAAETLDFSRIPPALLARTKLESVLMLHEILRRIPLPAEADVPDAAMMDRREGVRRTVWIIPGTPLQISRATDESRSNDFLFSPKTVSIIPEIYEKARRLPPRDHSALDAYQAFVNTPGGFLVPPRRFGYITRGPDWVRAPIAGQALFQ
jgi:MscS family membrane protein